MTRDPWNPFRDIESLFNQMSMLPSASNARMFRHPATGNMTVNVAEYDDEVEVTADLPGVSEDAIDIRVRDGTLTLTVEQQTRSETDDENPRFIRRERQQSMTLQRTVSIPTAVDEDEATAEYTNGVLTVTLPKLDSDDDGTAIEIN